MSDSVLAWHFSDGELRFDYAGVKVEAGLVLETDEKPVVEKKGFHASIRALDALRWYAVRPQTEFIISRVRLSGETIDDKQRLIAQKREHLWVADAKAVLEEFIELQRLNFQRLTDSLEQELVAIPLHPQEIKLSNIQTLFLGLKTSGITSRYGRRHGLIALI